MNVLEIYPTFSWWLCGRDAAEIEEVRQLLETDATVAETAHQAYYLVGDAAGFELIPGVFDQIVIRYDPTPLKRLVLDRHATEWLKPTGQLSFAPDAETETAFLTREEPRPPLSFAEWMRLHPRAV